MLENRQILQEIKQAVTSVDAGAKVILFGSRARGDFNDESDWDVLVLTDKEENDRLFKDKILGVLFDLELKTGKAISSIVKNKIYWEELSVTPLYREVEKDGVHL